MRDSLKKRVMQNVYEEPYNCAQIRCEGKIPFLVVLSGSEFRKVCTCTLIPKNIEKASSRVGSVPWGEAEDFVREFKETLASRFGNKIFNPSVPKDWGGSVNGEFLCLCT